MDSPRAAVSSAPASALKPSNKCSLKSGAEVQCIPPFPPSQRMEAHSIHRLTHTLIWSTHRQPLDVYFARHMHGVCFHAHKFNYILFWRVPQYP